MSALQEVKTQLVVIQPTPFCNINCRYCYLPDRSSTKRIDIHTLSRIFEVLFASPFVSNEITILWHAGEPLVLPIHFYENAVQLIEQFNIKKVSVINAVQTNGMLINQAWCDFFKQHHFRVGVSLDGPKHIHDSSRVDRSGKGTFDRVMQGIELLQKNDINPSIITVITKYALDHPDDIWQFFMEHNLTYLGFNAEEAEGANHESSLEAAEDVVAQYKRFFTRILELREVEESYPFLREVDPLIRQIEHATAPTKSQDNLPLVILSFDHEGNISTFSPELFTTTHSNYGNFYFGNVFDGSLESVLANPKFRRIQAEIQSGIVKCRKTCEYFDFCGGGSPSNKLHENGTFDSTETMACKLRIKAVTDAVLIHLEKEYNIET